MLEAYGVVTLADGQVLDLCGSAELLLANWRPDNLIVSVVDPDPLSGLEPEECTLALIQKTGGARVVVDQTEVYLANTFLLDCTL